MRSLLFPLLLAVLAAGCGDGRTPVVVYSPHGRDLLLLMERSFEAKPKASFRPGTGTKLSAAEIAPRGSPFFSATMPFRD